MSFELDAKEALLPRLEDPLLEKSSWDADSRSEISADNQSNTERVLLRQLRLVQRSFYILVAIYLVTSVGLVFFCAHLQQKASNCRGLEMFPSLEQDSHVVQFERKKLPIEIHHNPFVGDPSPELDDAWHELFKNIYFRVTKDDLRHADLESLELADGSGDYVGQLGLHHELHCLKQIRHWIYRDYYRPNLTEADYTENKIHVDHCIEALRVNIMCRGDTSMFTFAWLDGVEGQVTETREDAYHSCIKYDPLMDWIKERSVDLFDPDVLATTGKGTS